MPDYIRFRRSDGAIVQYGGDHSVQAMLAQVDEEHDVLETDGPAQAWQDVPTMMPGPDGSPIEGTARITVPNWDAVRGGVLRKIDAAAAALTEDPLATVHALKLAEARSDGLRPLLEAEAEATGQPIGDLVKLVLAKGEQAEARQRAVEVKRITARQAVRAMVDPRQIKAASTVDWPTD